MDTHWGNTACVKQGHDLFPINIELNSTIPIYESLNAKELKSTGKI